MKDYEIRYLRKKLIEEQQKVESQLQRAKNIIMASVNRLEMV